MWFIDSITGLGIFGTNRCERTFELHSSELINVEKSHLCKQFYAFKMINLLLNFLSSDCWLPHILGLNLSRNDWRYGSHSTHRYSHWVSARIETSENVEERSGRGGYKRD